MRKGNAWKMAFGGVTAALAVVIMCLGTLIPLATFICPVFCCLIGCVVLRLCGKKVAWAWYGSLCVLSLLLSPDKEAAAVYVMLGYYPLIKAFFDRLPASMLFKLLFFNTSVAVLYTLLMHLLGLSDILLEFGEFGIIGFLVLAFAGNLTFVLLDILLKRISVRRKTP